MGGECYDNTNYCDGYAANIGPGFQTSIPNYQRFKTFRIYETGVCGGPDDRQCCRPLSDDGNEESGEQDAKFRYLRAIFSYIRLSNPDYQRGVGCQRSLLLPNLHGRWRKTRTLKKNVTRRHTPRSRSLLYFSPSTLPHPTSYFAPYYPVLPTLPLRLYTQTPLGAVLLHPSL